MLRDKSEAVHFSDLAELARGYEAGRYPEDWLGVLHVAVVHTCAAILGRVEGVAECHEA